MTGFVPGRWLAPLLVAAALFSLVRGGVWLTCAFDALLLGLAVWDAKRAREASITLERVLPPRFEVNEEAPMALVVENRNAFALRVRVGDDLPTSFDAETTEGDLVVAPNTKAAFRYVVRPTERGKHTLGDAYVRAEGPLGLGAFRRKESLSVPAYVLPSFGAEKVFESARRRGSLRHFGFRRSRALGGGGEFEQLREYVSGDAYRDVDWKSSAKRMRPVTRVQTQEKGQTILLAIDIGRWMAPLSNGKSKLDIAIESALLLAFVALDHGDKVGILLFGSDVRAFVPPSSGRGQYRRLLDAVLDARTEETVVDFRRFAEFVRTNLPRRSLVVVFSDLFDETHGLSLTEVVPTLRRRHVPLCVSLDDAWVRERAQQASASEPDLFERAAASDLLAERESVRVRLRAAKVPLVEASAPELTLSVVNRYFEIRSRGVV